MKNLFATLFLTLVSVVPSAYALAAPQGHDGGNSTQRVIERIFSEAERTAIEEYYRARHADDVKRSKGGKGKNKGKGRDGLPPGLAKKDRLPPGLEKQLQRNGTLPPGLVRNDLPLSLQNKLYPPRKGTKRILVGSDVVLIDTKTDLILDILHDVVRASTR
jgi:Ni/Co efflux regulator RcnB